MNIVILEGMLIILFLGALWSWPKIKSDKLRRQTKIVMVIAFVFAWIMEATGQWHYTESLYYLPGGVPIEIALVYPLATVIWVYMIQRTYQTDIDSMTKFGAPELIMVIGIFFWVVDSNLHWLVIFSGISGLLLAERRELAIYIGLAAFVVEFVIEGIFLVNSGIVVWDSSYPLSTPISFMFGAWFLIGYVVQPRKR